MSLKDARYKGMQTPIMGEGEIIALRGMLESWSEVCDALGLSRQACERIFCQVRGYEHRTHRPDWAKLIQAEHELRLKARWLKGEIP